MEKERRGYEAVAERWQFSAAFKKNGENCLPTILPPDFKRLAGIKYLKVTR